jgi:hypothetical protein
LKKGIELILQQVSRIIFAGNFAEICTKKIQERTITSNNLFNYLLSLIFVLPRGPKKEKVALVVNTL